MSQRAQPLGTGNIRIQVGTQQGDEYSKDNTGKLCQNTEQEQEQDRNWNWDWD